MSSSPQLFKSSKKYQDFQLICFPCYCVLMTFEGIKEDYSEKQEKNINYLIMIFPPDCHTKLNLARPGAIPPGWPTNLRWSIFKITKGLAKAERLLLRLLLTLVLVQVFLTKQYHHLNAEIESNILSSNLKTIDLPLVLRCLLSSISCKH